MENILELENLQMYFAQQSTFLGKSQSRLRAVDGVSFSLGEQETLGLVGESGCGKSTIGRCIMRLYQPTSGRIKLMGQDITRMSERRLRHLRPMAQMIFQDPADSLDSRLHLEQIIEEPLLIEGKLKSHERHQRVCQLLDMVGLAQSDATRYPHELSGGQKQRVGIARALASSPKLLVLDEPVSALDVSVQAQILNLLLDLQKELKLSCLFISHDLSVVQHVSDRIAVMYMGRIVEMASAERIIKAPKHAYTRALLNAIPSPDPTKKSQGRGLPGEMAMALEPLPPGSPFGRRINHPYLEVTYGMNLSPREIEPGHWVSPDPCAISLSELMKLGIDIYQ